MKHEPGTDANVNSNSESETKSILDSAYCTCCNYDMKELEIKGQCPECGTEYIAEELRPRPLPGVFVLVMSFLWPFVPLVVVNVAFLWNNSDPYAGIGVMIISAIGLGIAAINSLYQGYLMTKRYTAPAFRAKSMTSRLRGIGGIVVGLFYVTGVLPALIVGGCTLLVCAGGL